MEVRRVAIKEVVVGSRERPFSTRWPRIYFWAADKEESVIEQFGNRWNRPYKLYRTLMPEVLLRLGVRKDAKYTWSQRAGCSCGCSPGFILKEKDSDGGWLGGRSVHVQVEGVPLTDVENADGSELAERRKVALENDPTMPEGMSRGVEKRQEASFRMRLENTKDNHFKRWSVIVRQVRGQWMEIRRWGRIGQAEMVKTFHHPTEREAVSAARKVAISKLRKGYEEVK